MKRCPLVRSSPSWSHSAQWMRGRKRRGVSGEGRVKAGDLVSRGCSVKASGLEKRRAFGLAGLHHGLELGASAHQLEDGKVVGGGDHEGELWVGRE